MVVSKPNWVWKHPLAHDICKSRSSKMCFPPRAGSTFSKKMPKHKEKRWQQASIIKLFEASYGDSKNELQIMIEKRPQIEKVLQTLTGATFVLIFCGGRRPCGGGLKGLMQPKSGSKLTFLKAFCLTSVFKNVLVAAAGSTFL